MSSESTSVMTRTLPALRVRSLDRLLRSRRCLRLRRRWQLDVSDGSSGSDVRGRRVLRRCRRLRISDRRSLRRVVALPRGVVQPQHERECGPDEYALVIHVTLALSKEVAAPGRSRLDATDDSAVCGAQRDRCRARCRDARSLLRRSRSSSDRNGSSARAADSRSSDTDESGLSGRRALFDYRSPMLFEAARDRRVVRVARTGARIDDEIHCGQFMLMLAKRFADETLDAIAAHRIPDDAGGDRQSKAREWSRRCCARISRSKASAERRASRYTRSNSDFCRRRCAGLNGRAGDKRKSVEASRRRSGSARERLRP